MKMKLLIAVLLAWSLSNAGFAQAPVEWPETRYEAAIPTFEQVLGYPPGAVISSHAQLRRYFDALQHAAPGQLRIVEYATSWEDRDLFYAVIGSAANIAQLDQLQASMQALADPRKTDNETAERLIAQTPGTTWLSYSVHGNEISSTDAAMMSAYHLLAARDDEQVTKILADSVVFINPLQNPDGRDRFVHAFRQAHGLQADPDRYTAEHDEPWPGGRTNHYHFDLNRDWLTLNQPETQGHVQALLRWYPLAFVDAHEMGSDSTYYFAPEAVPFNPHIAPDQRSNLQLFGRNNARWFDRFGIDYFTREIFDAFYPGYGASWPLYYGGIAMTYEQASVRGLVIRRRDGQIIPYEASVRNHFLTSLATAETVAMNREKLLRDFYQYRLSAIAAGREGEYREYIFSGQPDPSSAHELSALLVRQGIEVRRADAAFSACGKDYPTGSFAIPLAQPAHRMIRTLLDPQVSMDDEFLNEQERRREKDLPDEIYDVTAWSLPLMYNLEMDRCGRAISGDFSPASAEPIHTQAIINPQAKLAYLAPWGQKATARLLTAVLRQGIRVHSSDKVFSKNQQRFPAGSLIIKRAGNPDDLDERLTQLAAATGAEIIGVDDSWITEGPNFGSSHVVEIPAPRIALAWDRPTGAPGQTRYVLEQQYQYPVSAMRTQTLTRADLTPYQVLILPEAFRGDYGSVLGQSGASRLKAWVEQGGTLIALGNATRFVANPEYDLMALRREDAWRAEEKNGSAKGADDEKNQAATWPGARLDSREQWRNSLVPDKERPDSVSGALIHAHTDQDHWLAAGLPRQLNVLLRGSDIYSPLKLDQGSNVASFSASEDLLASGYLWEENRRQLAFKPFISIQPLGKGFIIAFTADPNYRAYLDGLNLAFINAVFRAPAHSGAIRQSL